MQSFENYGLLFNHKSSSYSAFLSLGVPTEINVTSAVTLLTEKELDQLSVYSGRRKAEFLYSRLLVKESVIRSVLSTTYDKIEITNGVFGQPMLVILDSSVMRGLSISHKIALIGSLIFDEAHPLGLDIELLCPKVNNTLMGKLTYKEREIDKGDHLIGVVVWSAKEALSKILRCGMTIPFNLLEVTNLQTNQKGYSGEFKLFQQYRFISFKKYDHIVTIVFPKESKINMESFDYNSLCIDP